MECHTICTYQEQVLQANEREFVELALAHAEEELGELPKEEG